MNHTPNSDYLARLENALFSENEIVVDTETTGLDWKRDCVVGWVFTFGPAPDDSFYVPIRHGGGGNIEGGWSLSTRDSAADHRGKQHPFERTISKAFSRPGVRVIGHNLKFDAHFAANHGVDFGRNVHCTQVAAALINENQGSFSLDNCCKIADVAAKKGDALYSHMAKILGGKPERSIMSEFWRMPGNDPVVLDYTLGDGTSTFELNRWQRGIIVAQDLDRVSSLEDRVLRTLFRMERRGIRIDSNRIEELREWLHKELDAARQKMPEGFSPRSPNQVRAYLESQGVTNWPKTPTGAPSFPEAFLKTVEPGRNIITLRKLSNLESSFIDPLANEHMFKGRVHANFNQVAADDFGVVTGRLSCNSPNMQQAPKRDKVLAPKFRAIFLPEEGAVWSSNDYKQQEYVVFADYTQAKLIIDGYKQEPPIDIHQVVADLLGVERDPTGKRINLGIIYGMGIPKLAASLGVDEATARMWMNTIHARVPEARQFLKNAEARAKQRGFVFTKMGRRRRFPNPGLAHKAGNSVIQGSSADITKLKMVEVDEFFESTNDGSYLMCQVHDSLEFSSTSAASLAEAQAIMQKFGPTDLIQLSLPLRIDSGQGPNWGVATFGEKYFEEVA